MDAQYKFLRLLCRLSKGSRWVPASELRSHWNSMPSYETLSRIGRNVYFESNYNKDIGEVEYIPLPAAFTHVRQCRDSIRNLIVTTVTLVFTALALLLQVMDSLLQ